MVLATLHLEGVLGKNGTSYTKSAVSSCGVRDRKKGTERHRKTQTVSGLGVAIHGARVRLSVAFKTIGNNPDARTATSVREDGTDTMADCCET